MAITFKNYTAKPFFTADYLQVREFIIRINRERLTTPNFTWGRWEWMTTHSCLDHSTLDYFGMWYDDATLVAFCCCESTLGDWCFCVDEDYSHLKPEIISYVKRAFPKGSQLRLLLPDGERQWQQAAVAQGFHPTQLREQVAAIDITPDLSYALPSGYSIVSMADGWDWYQYDAVMWLGFNHPAPPPQTVADIAHRRQMLSSPTINPELVLAVVAPDGSYAAHCGMWYLAGDDYAYVEPVATRPEYRGLGLAKAAVLEAVTRCGKLGAKQALVGSSQQFYYNIGFYPIHTETWWEPRASRR